MRSGWNSSAIRLLRARILDDTIMAELCPIKDFRAERVLAHEKLQHRAPKPLDEKRLRHRRQGDNHSIRTECPVSGKHVHVWVEVGQVPEGLHEQDQP